MFFNKGHGWLFRGDELVLVVGELVRVFFESKLYLDSRGLDSENVIELSANETL